MNELDLELENLVELGEMKGTNQYNIDAFIKLNWTEDAIKSKENHEVILTLIENAKVRIKELVNG